MIAERLHLDERAMRADLKAQIARLDGGAASGADGPRILSTEELEAVRDTLVARRGEEQRAVEDARVRLERMLLDPRAHRRETVALHDLGLPGCGVYRPRPRLGVIGRLAGWWQVKLSSGCP